MPHDVVLRAGDATPSPSPTSCSRADLAVCEGILRRGSKSFSAAARLLPARVRLAATAYYAFCRVTDDIVDAPEAGPNTLHALRARVRALHRGTPEDNPVDRAYATVVRTWQIPSATSEALLEGYAWDLDPSHHHPTLADTLAYAVRVAAVVGVVMTLLLGRRERIVLARACDMGVAMQLTNIARDVAEDAARGRVYLPADWLMEAGLESDAQVIARACANADARLFEVVARLLGVADDLYLRARAGVPALPWISRLAVGFAGAIYREIGHVLLRRGPVALRSRAFVSTWRKWWLFAGCLMPTRERRTTATRTPRSAPVSAQVHSLQRPSAIELPQAVALLDAIPS